MKTKMIPLILMLVAGGITSIITYLYQYEMKSVLTILLIVLIVFYVFGLIIKKIIDSFEVKEKNEEANEGEVIEKESIKEENTKEENAKEDNVKENTEQNES